MGTNVVELRCRPTKAALEKRVHELATDSGNIDFTQPHFRDRLLLRSYSMRQALEVLRCGEAVSEPKLDEW